MSELQIISELRRQAKELRRQQAKPLGPTLGELYAQMLGLPALRGLWFPGSLDNTGAMYDRSGQGRTLTYNGGPALVMNENLLLPYMDYDGSGDYHSRASEAGLQITGTETYVEATLRGLSIFGWWRIDSFTSSAGLMTKYNTTGNQRAYSLQQTATGVAMVVSVDGTATHTANSAAIDAARWHCIGGRFFPGVSTDVFVDGVWVSNTTAPPASTFATSTAAFEIMRRSLAGTETNGRFGLGGLAAAAWPDELFNFLWQRSRPLFGI